MKKHIIVVLSLLLLIALVGCSSSKKENQESTDTEAVYNAAVDKMESLEAMDTSMSIRMSFLQGGESVDMTMNTDGKLLNQHSEDLKYMGTMKAAILGQEVEMNLMFDNQTYYADVMGQKVKCTLDYKKLLEQVNKCEIEPKNMTQFITNLKEKKSDENVVITYNFSEDKITKYIQDLMNNMGSGLDTDNISFTKLEGNGETTIDKDGYFSTVKMTIKTVLESGGKTMDMELSTTMKYNKIGDAVEDFEIPDTSEYTEIDPSQLNLE